MSKLALALVLASTCAFAHAQGPVLNAKPADVSKQDNKAATTPQDKPAGANTINVTANLVVIPVSIRDTKGALVKDLTQADFALKIGDDPQTIRYFDKDNDQPLTLGLLVDVSGSMRNDLPEEKKASQAFLDSMLQPATPKREADKAFVVHFAHDIELLQDVTDSPTRLQKAINQLGTESSSFHTSENAGTDSEQRRQHGMGTSLYDSIYLASKEILSKQKGRKALIVLTDGVDSGSKESLNDALEAAQRADVSIYAVYYKGEQPHDQQQRGPGGGRRGGYGGGYPGGGGGYPGGGGGYPGGGGGYPSGGGNNPNGNCYPNDPNCTNNPNNNGGNNNPNGGNNRPAPRPHVDGKQVMERICGDSGGRVFEVSKKQPIDDIYKQIADELRTQYRIGFTPTDKAARNGYHQIDLRLNNKDKKWDIQCRDGYYVGD